MRYTREWNSNLLTDEILSKGNITQKKKILLKFSMDDSIFPGRFLIYKC